MKIRINRHSFNEKKAIRKIKIKTELGFRNMRAIFSQLKPIDEMRIINRVNREMKNYQPEDCMFPHAGTFTKRLQLAYKYALGFVDTIII